MMSDSAASALKTDSGVLIDQVTLLAKMHGLAAQDAFSMCQMDGYHTFKYELGEDKFVGTKLISVYNPNLTSL